MVEKMEARIPIGKKCKMIFIIHVSNPEKKRIRNDFEYVTSVSLKTLRIPFKKKASNKKAQKIVTTKTKINIIIFKVYQLYFVNTILVSVIPTLLRT